MAPQKEANQAEGDEGEGGDDAQAQFWAEHKTRTTDILNEWFDTKTAELRKSAKSSSRNGGRATVPSILADFFFPEKQS